jgi:hypothetical protein
MPGGSDRAMPRSPINIPEPRDVNVGTYSDWHGSHVDDPVLKQQFQSCGALTLAEGYDLEQLFLEYQPCQTHSCPNHYSRSFLLFTQ